MRTKSSVSIDVLSYLHQNGKHLEKLFTHLPHFLQGRNLAFEEIDNIFLDYFKAYLSERLMPSTVKDRMSCLRTLVKRAIAEGITVHDPFVEYRIEYAETDKPYYNSSQIKELLKVSENIDQGVVNSFLFALYTGFHRAKIIKLTIDETSKLSLNRTAKKLLQTIVNTAKDPDSLLFDLPCISNYHRQTRIWEALAGLSLRPTLEHARNTYIIYELAKGLSIKEIAKNLGVKDLRHLQAYKMIYENKQSLLMKAKAKQLYPIEYHIIG